MKLLKFAKANLPWILTGIGLAAGAGSLYFTYRKAPAISAVLNDPDKTKKEKFVGVLKEGAIPITLAVISGGCTVSGQYIAAARTAQAVQAAATASTAAAIASRELRDFQTKTREVVGDEKFKEIKEVVAEEKIESGYSDVCQPTNTIKCVGGGNTLWYDAWHDRWFRAAPQHVEKCIEEVNNLIFDGQDYATVADVYSRIGVGIPENGIDTEYGWASRDSMGGIADRLELVECKAMPYPETGELGRFFEIYPSPVYKPDLN